MCLPSVRSHFPLYSANKNDLVWRNFDLRGTSMEKSIPWLPTAFLYDHSLKKNTNPLKASGCECFMKSIVQIQMDAILCF